MNSGTPIRDEQLARIVEGSTGTRSLGGIAAWIAALVLLIAAAAAYVFYEGRQQTIRPPYVTQPSVRGNLIVRVSATGNLQSIKQVDVGSELSGTVESVMVDENDHVRRGQVLARLDVSKLNDAVSKSKALLAASRAQVEQMQALVEQNRLNLERLQHVAQLSGGKVPSKGELDAARAALKVALANHASARATVAQNAAALRSDQTNLVKASIRSPIDGVVLTRKVQPGQTVAASLQAPVLFTLAEDLKKMELDVEVDEADVGQVKEGQPVSFKVDAYPGRSYPARVDRVGYGSQTIEGVVSYKTVIYVSNQDLSLRPGMTATAEITTVTRENALLVPNAALRFTPPRQAAPERAGGGLLARLLPHRPRRARPPAAANPTKGGAQRVWILREGELHPVPVTLGASDGRMTEITSGALAAGDAVVVEAVSRP